MNKDHKMVLSKLKNSFEGNAEDKEYLHEQLINQKLLTKQLMQELDSYRAKFGTLDAPKYETMKAITNGDSFNNSSGKKHAKQVITE
jgi:hypothetical protein